MWIKVEWGACLPHELILFKAFLSELQEFGHFEKCESIQWVKSNDLHAASRTYLFNLHRTVLWSSRKIAITTIPLLQCWTFCSQLLQLQSCMQLLCLPLPSAAHSHYRRRAQILALEQAPQTSKVQFAELGAHAYKYQFLAGSSSYFMWKHWMELFGLSRAGFRSSETQFSL